MFKILIVDPNVPFRQSLRNILIARFPFVDIKEASDGNEGLGNIETFQPNLIFLEIQLPAGNGLDLARRIKAGYPNIMIVVLTSYNIQEYQEAVEELGVEHMIPKDDWTGEDIIKLVQSIMSELDLDLKSKQNRDQLHEQSS